MASSAKGVGSTSKWSCESLRDGYQFMKDELARAEDLEKLLEKEIQDPLVIFFSEIGKTNIAS